MNVDFFPRGWTNFCTGLAEKFRQELAALPFGDFVGVVHYFSLQSEFM